jgi:hypothetical protein
MKYLRWMIVILGIFVCLSSIIPRVDAPETAYDETDAPVNVATPLVARTNVVMPAAHIVAISREQQVAWKSDTAMHIAMPKPVLRVSHSLLDLLCTLLC